MAKRIWICMEDGRVLRYPAGRRAFQRAIVKGIRRVAGVFTRFGGMIKKRRC